LNFSPWHVTEITLDHFRPSPKWIREGQDLAAAKKREAIEARGFKELAEQQRQQEEKMRMLREVIEEWRENGNSLGSRGHILPRPRPSNIVAEVA